MGTYKPIRSTRHIDGNRPVLSGQLFEHSQDKKSKPTLYAFSGEIGSRTSFSEDTHQKAKKTMGLTLLVL